MSTPHEIPAWARAARPANVRATGSDAPEEYSPLPRTPPGSLYTVRGHAAQYGRRRRNGRTIRAIVLHTTESTSFAGSMTYDAWRPEQVSAHLYLGELGELGYCVPETDRAWTQGRWNDEVLFVEIVGRAAWTAYQWWARPRQLAALADHLEEWCRRHKIPATWLGPAEFAEGASRQSTTPRQGTRRGITDHLDANRAAILLGGSPAVYSHHDIGDGLRWIVMSDILPEVARRLAGAPTPPPPTPPYTPNPGGTMSTRTDFAQRRLLDTRTGSPIAAGGEVVVELGAGAAIGATVTVTAVHPQAFGFLTAWPGGNRPEVSCLNFAPGQTVANTTAVPVDGNGRFRLYTSAPTHLVVDLVAVHR